MIKEFIELSLQELNCLEAKHRDRLRELRSEMDSITSNLERIKTRKFTLSEVKSLGNK